MGYFVRACLGAEVRHDGPRASAAKGVTGRPLGALLCSKAALQFAQIEHLTLCSPSIHPSILHPHPSSHCRKMSLQPLLITTAIEAVLSLALGALSAYTVSHGHASLSPTRRFESAYSSERSAAEDGVKEALRPRRAEELTTQHTLEALRLPEFTQGDVEALAAAVTVVCAARLLLELALICAVAGARRARKKRAAKALLLMLCIFVT